MRSVKVIAWSNLIGNILIVATGGIVRLSGSGLGCTDAVVACSSDSFFPTAAEGVQGIIEFSNRCVTGLIGVIAVLAVIFVYVWARRRVDLLVHVWIILGGIVLDAVLGAVVVGSALNAWTVGTHFLISMVLIGVSASFVIRSGELPGAREHLVDLGTRILTHVTTLFLALVVIGGVVLTANGPHSGDASVIHTSDAWTTIERVHSWLGYALGFLLLVLLVSALIHREWRFTRAVITVIAIVAVQIAVGIIQAQFGLPVWLVGIHMVLAAITVATAVWLVQSLKAPVAVATDAQLDDFAGDGELNGSVA